MLNQIDNYEGTRSFTKSSRTAKKCVLIPVSDWNGLLHHTCAVHCFTDTCIPWLSRAFNYHCQTETRILCLNLHVHAPGYKSKLLRTCSNDAIGKSRPHSAMHPSSVLTTASGIFITHLTHDHPHRQGKMAFRQYVFCGLQRTSAKGRKFRFECLVYTSL